jgi:hypothetical protein
MGDGIQGRFAVIRAAVIASLLLAGGCYESANVTLYEPGEYKGGTDPLLDAAADPAFRDRLRERIRHGQTDR